MNGTSAWDQMICGDGIQAVMSLRSACSPRTTGILESTLREIQRISDVGSILLPKDKIEGF